MEIHETGYAWRFIRKLRELALFTLVNYLSQVLRCHLWVLSRLSVITEICSWTEDTVSCILWTEFFNTPLTVAFLSG